MLFKDLWGILMVDKNTEYTDTAIDDLVDQVIEAMTNWNTFFSLLQ